LQERQDAWRKCGASITISRKSDQLPDIIEVRPEYRDVHLQVLQDVPTRRDRALQAFFRRIESGEAHGNHAFRGATAPTASPTSSSVTGQRESPHSAAPVNHFPECC
jgi:putative transposase